MLKINDYDRPGAGLLITSGFGLGLGLMDVLLRVRYFCDIDNHRDELLDWECEGVNLSFDGRFTHILLAGWFTIDKSNHFKKLASGILLPKLIYVGGENLSEFIAQAQILLS